MLGGFATAIVTGNGTLGGLSAFAIIAAIVFFGLMLACGFAADMTDEDWVDRQEKHIAEVHVERAVKAYVAGQASSLQPYL